MYEQAKNRKRKNSKKQPRQVSNPVQRLHEGKVTTRSEQAQNRKRKNSKKQPLQVSNTVQRLHEGTVTTEQ
jgi:hypothetical protein